MTTPFVSKSMRGSDWKTTDSFGDPGVREAITSHLRRRYGIRAEKERVVVIPSPQIGIDLAVRTVMTPGESILLEDPCNRATHKTLQSLDLQLIPVPVDQHGLRLVDAPSHAERARMIYVTPSHQIPMGWAMSTDRKTQLLQWAENRRTFIIEDESDGELANSETLEPPLAAMDGPDRVIFIGSISYAPIPDERFAYAVLPEPLVGRAGPWMNDARRQLPAGTEDGLAEFLAHGFYDQLVDEARVRARKKRQVFEEALREGFGQEIEIGDSHAGTQLTIWFPDLSITDEARLIQFARALRVTVVGLSTFYIGPVKRAGLVLGYGNLGEDQIQAGVKRLLLAWKATHEPSPANPA